MVSKKDTPKKPGGQPGNKNAARHGFYSARFQPAEKADLTRTASEKLDVIGEIALLRTYINRLAKQIELKEKPDEKAIASLYLLTNMTIAVSTQVRTHYLIYGKGSEVEISITQALEEIRLELGI